MLAAETARQPTVTLDDIKAPFGASYRAMIEEVSSTLANLKSLFPQYEGQGYEIAGFVWFHGWNDMINDQYTAEYTTNLTHFIRDVRKGLKAPNMPFVIGQMGVGGIKDANARTQKFKDAQAAVMKVAEFKGNVAVVKTDEFWDLEADAVFKKGWRQNIEEWNKVGSDFPFHYLGSAKTMCRIGKAFGEAMLALRSQLDKPSR